MIRVFFSNIQKKTFVITFEKAIAVVFKLILLIIKVMLPIKFINRENGDVRTFSKNYINCFILVILRNIRDISMKWFFDNFSVALKSPIIIITKS